MQALEIFTYKECEIRKIEKDGTTWFVAKDICKILDIQNVSQALQRLDIFDISDIYIETNSGRGSKQTLKTVNESGLYNLIFTSQKEGAKEFKRWVTSEVLPSIRKTGQYKMQRSNDEMFQSTTKCLEIADSASTLVGEKLCKVWSGTGECKLHPDLQVLIDAIALAKRHINFVHNSQKELFENYGMKVLKGGCTHER